jgi:hypothetical protein
MKIQLITGETVDIDIDDYLAIDFTTPEGKAACQDILNYKDFVKKWDNPDLAESEDILKFFDDDIKIKDVSLEEFEEDIYKEILKNNDLI